MGVCAAAYAAAWVRPWNEKPTTQGEARVLECVCAYVTPRGDDVQFYVSFSNGLNRFVQLAPQLLVALVAQPPP